MIRVTLNHFTFESLDLSGDEPMLALRVRRWLRWRTEHWVRRVIPRPCTGCNAEHDFWFRASDGADLDCKFDYALNRLFYARTHMASGVPDNVVPLHRGGLYR